MGVSINSTRPTKKIQKHKIQKKNIKKIPTKEAPHGRTTYNSHDNTVGKLIFRLCHQSYLEKTYLKISEEYPRNHEYNMNPLDKIHKVLQNLE